MKVFGGVPICGVAPTIIWTMVSQQSATQQAFIPAAALTTTAVTLLATASAISALIIGSTEQVFLNR